MTSDDLPGFHDAFRSLQRVFPLRGTEGELDRIVADYFRALRKFPLSDVKAAAEHLLAHGTKFPKPAEWMAAVPRRASRGELRAMRQDEAIEYRRAERLGFEDTPCGCRECLAAGVQDKPLRFVPEFDSDEQAILVFHPLSQHPVTAGHWAHGQELFRWYDARATFYAQYFERFGAAPAKALRLMKRVGQEAPRPAVVRQQLREIIADASLGATREAS